MAGFGGIGFCCCEIPQQVCTTMTVPLGWDVIIPSEYTCDDDSDPNTVTATDRMPCICSDLPGTHKVFSRAYVNQKDADDACNWAASNTACQYWEIDPDTKVDGVLWTPATTECTGTPAKLYEPIASYYHRCRLFVPEVLDPPTPAHWVYLIEPYCEEVTGEDQILRPTNSPRVSRLLVTVGSDLSGNHFVQCVVTIYRINWQPNVDGDACELGVNQFASNYSRTYRNNTFSANSNLIEEGPITLTMIGTPSNEPATITVVANSLGIPT